VPPNAYDAALVCAPDAAKLEVVSYLLAHGKHVLVEKPLAAADDGALDHLIGLSTRTGAVCYTAYNHRFEPHIVRMKETIEQGVLGRLYVCRLFYGNGTARDVRESAWRDRGAGVLPDLGSHLLDIVLFWFGSIGEPLTAWSANRFENRAFDHMICGGGGTPAIELEMSLVSWRNHFTADVYGEKGSAHIASLCKRGPSTFVRRTRVLPSGRPAEEEIALVQPDPTWALEYEHFTALCRNGERGNLGNDVLLNRALNGLASSASAGATR